MRMRISNPVDHVDAEAIAVRAGEELEIDGLRRYLEAVLDEPVRDLRIRQFPDGFSNLTYLVSAGGLGTSPERRWVLRRPPFGNRVRSAHDMAREFRVLQALQPVFPPAPRPIHLCEDPAVLGCQFYLMSCINGIIVRRRDHPVHRRMGPLQVRRQFLAMFDGLASLHAVEPKAIGLEGLGRPQGYVRRQVEGWSRRYRASATTDAPDFDAVMQWLDDHMPVSSPPARLLHNDFKLDNVVWSDDGRLAGILDWEMATVGDPLLDLGCALGYWAEADDPGFYRAACAMPTDVPGAPTRSEIVARFGEQTGLKVDCFDFYLCFGMFRLAAIAQQIYYRYCHGLTGDPRFAHMINKVSALHEMCGRLIARSDL